MARPKLHIVTLTEVEQKQLASIAGNYRYSRLETIRRTLK